AEMHDLADGAKAPGLVGDGAHQIGLRFERGIAAAGGHARLHAAAHRRIEQRHGEAAVHHADRVVMLLARREFKYGVTWLDLDQAEPQELRDRRRRQAAVADRSEEVMPGIERPAAASAAGSLHSTVRV